MKNHMTHTFYYVLAYYSETGELEWITCDPVTTDFDTAKKRYDEIREKFGYPVKLRAKTVTWETIMESDEGVGYDEEIDDE